MKKLVITSLSLLLAVVSLSAIDFTTMDRLVTESDWNGSKELLEKALPDAKPGHEKSEVLWRLSRVHMLFGDVASSKSEKRAEFGKGIELASEAIKEDPQNENGYLWHCANVGRECQTHGLMEQASKVSVLIDDLASILDKIGKVNCSEAWQALAEIYYNHPMKSSDAAANFTRKAITNIPKGEVRMNTYILLAKILYDRNWNAEKRSKVITEDSEKFKKNYGSNFDKYAYFDGSQGSGYVPGWSKKALGSMSDREEAKALLEYAKSMYNGKKVKTRMDEKDYKELAGLLADWK